MGSSTCCSQRLRTRPVPHRSPNCMGIERLSCSPQVRSAARSLESPPQEAKVVSCGTARTARITCQQHAQLLVLGRELLVEPGDVLVGEQQELLQPRHLGGSKGARMS